MIQKIYGMIWAFIGAVAAILFLTGNFTQLTFVVFGFISFGMIFMGMIAVLPITVAHPAPKKVKTAEKTKTESKEFLPGHIAQAR